MIRFDLSQPGRVAACMSLLVLTLGLIGCGGSSDNTADSDSQTSTSDASSSSSEPSSMALPPEDSGGAQDAAPPESSMELPDIPATTETGDAETPKQEGGGFELPDLNDSSKTEPTVDVVPPVAIANWQAIVDQAKSTGKVTVVDVWSTSCAPCLKEFPGLVRLNAKHDAAVECISVNIDYDGRKKYPAETYSEKVTAFLGAMKASQINNFICGTPSDEVLSINDLVSIPAVLIFDKEGNLVKRFIDSGDTIGFTYEEHIIPYVESVL